MGIKVIVKANVVFWIATNFICWFAWYPMTLAGFLRCYYLAIPFFFLTLVKTWAFIKIIEMVILVCRRIHGRQRFENRCT